MLSFIKLSVTCAEGRNKANYTECPQVVCHSAECRVALTREPGISRIPYLLHMRYLVLHSI
jgi:hypothetical protein